MQPSIEGQIILHRSLVVIRGLTVQYRAWGKKGRRLGATNNVTMTTTRHPLICSNITLHRLLTEYFRPAVLMFFGLL